MEDPPPCHLLCTNDPFREMKRNLFSVILAFCLIPQTIYAQQKGTLTGTVVDEQTQAAMPGAVVEIVSVKNPASVQRFSAGTKGAVSVGLEYGVYDVKVTFLGYEDYEKRVNVNRSAVGLGVVAMKESAVRIDNVVLEVQAMRTSQKGDTVIYNADAFKVSKDADAESMLAKMPGINIVDGNVEAQGETVKKVFVDGKEFFGDDVASTIKNLPAEVIDKVEVFNKLSDQAEFTGFDDGEGFKAINIVTHKNMRNGVFGKLYAGYGFNDKYLAGGNVSTFTEKHRLSFIGQYNNVNNQNFSTSDILGVMGGGDGFRSAGGRMRGAGSFAPVSNGISKIGSFGVNYTAEWSPKVKFEGSYFYSGTNTENTSLTDAQQFVSTDVTRVMYDTTDTRSKNYSHRFDGKLDYKIDDNNTIMIRPSVRLQKYESYRFKDGVTYTKDVTGVLSPLNETTNLSDGENDGYNISLRALYRHKFGKPGRTLTINLDGRINKNDRDSYSNAYTYTYGNTPPDTTIIQNIYNNSKGYNLNSSISYTEPLGEKSQLSAEYAVRYSYSDADKKSYLWDNALNAFNPYYTESLSSIYDSGYLRQTIGPGYRFNNEMTMLVVNVNYQRSTLKGDQDIPLSSHTKKSFDNVVYFSMLNINFNKQNSLRMFLRSNTSEPSVTQLQSALDLSDPQNVSRGNPDLKPSYTHNLMATYNLSSVNTGQSLMISLGGSIKQNGIANYTITPDSGTNLQVDDGEGNMIDLETNAQYTNPVNVDGYWTTNLGVSFGTPMNLMRSNLNFSANVNYTESPNYVNPSGSLEGIKNYSKTLFANGGATLSSNISDKIDFTLSYNIGYGKATNTGIDNKNEYWNQSASGQFKIEIWKGITLSGSGSYTFYKGITDDFKESYVILNAYLGKKIFKNRRGELSIGINDLLDENTGFSRSIRDNYISNQTNRVVGRYVGFQFVYNLRSFSGSGRQSYDGEGGRPDSLGPPPGGGEVRIYGPPPGGGGGGGVRIYGSPTGGGF